MVSDVSAYDAFISKPNNGWGGKGIKKIYKANEANDKNVIVQPFVFNAEYSKEIFDGSLNTIRILTCILDGEVEVIAAVHRFGSLKTGAVDNFSAGGVSAYIQESTGMITSAVQFDGRNKTYINKHPDTNVNIVGVKIPNWSVALQEIKQLHNKISFVPYVGWDIAINEESFLIVEANHVSDIDLIQCHGGLLNKEIASRFYSREM